jgi:hypothetical protein
MRITTKTSDTQLIGARFALAAVALSALAGVTACAPEPIERSYVAPNTSFGQLQEDPDLGLEDVRPSVDTRLLHWKGDVETPRVLRTAENLMELGRLRGRTKISQLGYRLSDAFYSSPGTVVRLPLDKSPYISAAIGETKTDTVKMVEETQAMLSDQERILIRVLDESGKSYPWPKPGASVERLLESAESYGNALLERAGRSALVPEVLAGLREGVNQQLKPLVEELRKEVSSIFREPNPKTVIAKMRKILEKHEVPLGSESEAQLKRTEEVISRIETMNEAHDALVVLIDLWQMSTPERRILTFKKASPELYDFLKDKSDDDLTCLRRTGCLNPISIIAKQFGLLPKIREYGVKRLRGELIPAVKDGIISEVEHQAASLMPELPTVITDRCKAEITRIRTELTKITQDYPAFVRELARAYASQNLGSKDGSAMIAGIETGRVSIDLQAGRTEVRAPEIVGKVDSGAETIGASLALAATRWYNGQPVKDEEFSKDAIAQISKMLAMGGFKAENGKLFPSLSVSVNPNSNRQLDVRNLLSTNESFGIPDKIKIDAEFRMDITKAKSMSVRGQAEVLRGISGMIRFLRDWETNRFDRTLGAVEVGRLISQLPAQNTKDKLFPKDMLFSLGVGNAASILLNLTKPMASVFLLDLDRRTVWANEFQSERASTATMAGIVDIEDGKRLATVRSRDVARFLVGVLEFIKATDGIQRTKSGPLLERGKDGRRSLDVLIESRAQLRLLAVGLSNFLTHEMQNKDGGIQPRFSRVKAEVHLEDPRTLLDQVVVADALARAGNVLGINIYRWAALDILAFMNRTLWNPETGFYRAVEDLSADLLTPSPNLEETVATLVAGERLRPIMSPRSRSQWDKIAQPWIAALEKL